MFDDTRNAERLVQDCDGTAHVIALIGTGKDVVYDHVVRALEGATGDINKRLESVVCGVIDPEKNLDLSDSRELLNGRRDNGNVREFADCLSEFRRHGRYVHCGKHASIVGAKHQVGADAVGALLGVVQHSHDDARDGQDHDDFNGYRQHTD